MHAPPAPRVARPVMLQRWSELTFLHWRYDPGVVQALLPRGLEVETIDGGAWVGLIPFLMEGVRTPGVPALPWASRFPETNVRTYVRGPDGQAGIWFLSLDAARLPAVLTARATYGLPYFWSRMSVERDGGRVRYGSRRRWPGLAGAGCAVTVEPGDPYDPGELGALDHFLTARFVLFTVIGGRLASARAEHGPWPLARARLLTLDQSVIEAGGLPPPRDPPLVHHSPGVSVRVGAWHRAAAPAGPVRT